jgi:DNA-binding MarR family transcriptional regulator
MSRIRGSPAAETVATLHQTTRSTIGRATASTSVSGVRVVDMCTRYVVVRRPTRVLVYRVAVAGPDPDIDADLVLLLQACTAALGDRVLAEVRSAAGPHVRYSDGYAFQHLVAGPLAVSELGRRLGVTQQAASLQVADLERRDLVRRVPHPTDGRSRLVELSARGRRAVEAARRARQAVATELADVLGPRRMAGLLGGLRAVSEHTGAVERMGSRRLRPEAQR